MHFLLSVGETWSQVSNIISPQSVIKGSQCHLACRLAAKRSCGLQRGDSQKSTEVTYFWQQHPLLLSHTCTCEYREEEFAKSSWLARGRWGILARHLSGSSCACPRLWQVVLSYLSFVIIWIGKSTLHEPNDRNLTWQRPVELCSSVCSGGCACKHMCVCPL